MSAPRQRRVVITGMGVVCPLGLSLDDLWAGLSNGVSAVRPIEAFPADGLPLKHAAEARGFTGDISNYGPLDAERKKAIRKGCKVMCRETQMAVAAAQWAIHDCGISPEQHQPERFGCVFGSDYMLTLPEDFTASVAKCRESDGTFNFKRWATEGLPLLTPLWLLRYLPNMPASHIAIFNDLRGPSNSLTLREASGHLAIGEATSTIQRGAADVMLAGSTGTRVHPMKAVHALQCEQVAMGDGDPTGWSRPFEKSRKGMVLGEGSAVLVLEELEHALARGARIYAEILGHAARHASDTACVGANRRAMGLAMQGHWLWRQFRQIGSRIFMRTGSARALATAMKPAPCKTFWGPWLTQFLLWRLKATLETSVPGVVLWNALPVFWRCKRGNCFRC